MTEWTHQERMNKILEFLSRKTGLSFRNQRRGQAEKCLKEFMNNVNETDYANFERLLQRNQFLQNRLIAELTNGETYFFRETAHFEMIRSGFLPERRKRGDDLRGLRIWSAGCASGEEPYSLAILFHQLGIKLSQPILATDLSINALEKAQEGTFRPWSFRGPGADQARPYCEPGDDDMVTITESIRRQVSFRKLNLVEDAFPAAANGTTKIDLLFCRNVLIYFDQDIVSLVAKKFADSLSERGWLITASTDPPLEEHAELETVITPWGVAYGRKNSQQKRPPMIPSSMDAAAEIETVIETTPLPRRQPQTVPARTVKSKPLAFQNGSVLQAAAAALDAGDCQKTLELVKDRQEEQACLLRVQAWANQNTTKAVEKCEAALERHPDSSDLLYLRAVLHIDQSQISDAIELLERVVYLDSSRSLAHLTLGLLRKQQGEIQSAARSFRNARNQFQSIPSDCVVPLSGGETAGTLQQSADTLLQSLSYSQ